MGENMYQNIAFKSHRHMISGRLYTPTDRASNGAGIVLAHGFSGTMDSGLFDYAAYFAAQGFHALVFDYRYFGQSEGMPRQFLSVPAQRTDWRAAIDYIRSCDAVNSDRIGLWGYSFSGGHVLHLLSEDRSLRCAVAQCPQIDPFATAQLTKQYMTAETAAYVQSVVLKDWWGGLIGRRPISLAVAPGSGAAHHVMVGPEAVRFADIAGPNWVNAIIGRSFISGRLSQNNPSALVDKIRQPVLLQVADHDRIVSNEAIETLARRLGRQAHLHHYDADHFSIALKPCFDQVVRHAVSFFNTQLST